MEIFLSGKIMSDWAIFELLDFCKKGLFLVSNFLAKAVNGKFVYIWTILKNIIIPVSWMLKERKKWNEW